MFSCFHCEVIFLQLTAVLVTGKKHGITEIHPDVVSYVSHATQQRLQNLVEKLSETAQQKNISYKVTVFNCTNSAGCCDGCNAWAQVFTCEVRLFICFDSFILHEGINTQG